MSTEERHLIEKARLLLQREREYFELLQTYERFSVWAALGQALPEVFLERKCPPEQRWDRVRKLLISRSKLQRVIVLELHGGQLRPLSPAGPASSLPEEVRSLLVSKSCGFCNDPDAADDQALRPLSQCIGLHRFMWGLIAGKNAAQILIVAGFDRAKASFQSPFTERELASYKNTSQLIEFLLANAQLVVELEAEKAGLERRVTERTAELYGRNRELRLVLDSIDQALVTVTLDGYLKPERSRAFDLWFGPYSAAPGFLEHVAPDPRFAGLFRLGLSAIQEGFLPLPVCLDQMPGELTRGERTFICRYLPIEEEGGVSALLLVIDDVTEAKRQAKADAEQRDLLAAFSALTRDRSGFIGFVDEVEQLISRLRAGGEGAAAEQWRALHTLKGSAATLGLHWLAARCHAAEDELAELGHLRDSGISSIVECWRSLRAALSDALPTRSTRTIEVSEADLDALAALARQGQSAAQLVDELRRLRAEPVTAPLERQALHAKSLAARLGKPDLVVDIQADELRLEPSTWAPFWSALLHVVRNAVDHGIEDPGERGVLGKPPAGRLDLHARIAGDGFRLVVADDGRGIDWELIRARCREQGRPHQVHADLVDALTSTGFSSKRQVSETSGRGVGLAAVVAALRELGGALDIESTPGCGTRLIFSFPELGRTSRQTAP